jgi:hypothetical protein
MRRIATLFAVAALAGCATPDISSQPAAKRLSVVVVPEVDFRSAAMSDIVNFIASSWHCLCHPLVYPTQDVKGDFVTYIFHVDAYNPHDATSSIGLIKGTNETAIVRLGPTITFHAENISVFNLLTQIVKEADGSLDIHGDEVTIKTRKIEPSSPPYSEKVAIDPF